MSQLATDTIPDVHHLITEDDTPVDNMFSEKQQRLLTEPLYSSWSGPGAGRTFLAATNVGVFAVASNPAIVPDMFLSLDVEVAKDWYRKEHRSYFLWEFGKPPDLVLEIVSNKEGDENDGKKTKYADMRASYYVIYDPLLQVMPEVLTVYRLGAAGYERQETPWCPLLPLGLTLWEGFFEGKHDTWLRWTDEHGVVIPTGQERAQQAQQWADQERQRADQEHQRADQERQRADQAQRQVTAIEHRLSQETAHAERLARLLRQAGIDPGQV